ncbi:MAG: efflux RND transporter periplasmic adaptor subunit [Gammaproteobacteria bacterium]|nr:efflux RND transporter periplasmic adaptor subunit [Gammaproteobacteria bacterium]MYC97971.1 efflux RND transporter periplasmic adaptor subunit [Gammaproteobacteria bacterium]MYF62108.1 efflux RND transporter periplasmic adaptor subunit [Gammaproteobacteria bacterium]MYI23750.1 efflux RND transporter periplasmic adaptor subunit [Gammaproteobacteria bacterium]
MNVSTKALTNGGVRLLALLAVAACNGADPVEEAPGLTTMPALRDDLRLVAEATGLMEPVRTVEVKSKASGEILRLHVDTGDELEPGALLAEIDPRDVRNDFNQTEADLNVARARVEISTAQLERSRLLLEAGVITEAEHESANLDFANAQANLVKATTSMELAELRLSDVTIRAPMAGTIIQKNVEEGQVIQSASQNVSGGTTLFMMANLAEMQVRTLVDETDVGQISADLTATVTVEAFPGRTFAGIVDKIEPQAEVQQNVTMFAVIVMIDNRGGLLKPGMNAEVEILVAERPNALLIPNNALVQFQEMAPAAMVLGMDPDAIEMDRSVFADLRASLPGSSGAPGGFMAAPDGAPGRMMAGQRPMGGMDGNARLQELRDQLASGEISREQMREQMMQARAANGGDPEAAVNGDPGAGTGRPGARAGGAVGRPGAAAGNGAGMVGTGPAAAQGMMDAMGAGVGGFAGRREQEGAPRPAITFVVSADGAIEPRPILIGVNDWDNTEVLVGLEEGEEVALIGAAQLQAQQQEFIDRMRERMGGSPFGGGTPRGGRR